MQCNEKKNDKNYLKILCEKDNLTFTAPKYKLLIFGKKKLKILKQIKAKYKMHISRDTL